MMTTAMPGSSSTISTRGLSMMRAAGSACAWPSQAAGAGVGQINFDFKYIQIALVVNLDVAVVDLHVFLDDGNQLGAQRGQVIRGMGAALTAFMGQDDLQPLFCHRGGFLFIALRTGA